MMDPGVVGLGYRSIGPQAATEWQDGSGTYSAQATAYFAAMAVQPDSTRKALIDTLITGLVADGSWALLDLFYIIAAHDAQAARVNARIPGGPTLTVNGTCTFIVDRGYSGDQLTGYLDTGYAHNAMPTMTQNSMSQHVAFNFLDTVGRNSVGTLLTGSPNVFSLSATQVVLARANSGSGTTWTPASMQGVHSVTRMDPANWNGYSDGNLGVAFAEASTAPQASNICLLRQGGQFSPNRISFYAIGQSLSPAQVISLASRVKTFLTAIGAL